MQTRKEKNLKPKNKFIREISAGGVVYKRDEEGIKFLLLKKTGARITWVLPKGKIDKGESVEEAAQREVQEETGLSQLKIIKKLGEENYFYRSYQKEKFLVKKTVYYFLMRTEGREKPLPQREEGFIGYGWFKPESAQKKVTFLETKKIIALAQKELRNL